MTKRNIFVRPLRLLRLYYKYIGNSFALDDLIFFVTYKCNFRCRTCFYAEAMDNSAATVGQELDIDEISMISSSIGRLNKLLISGGEPFLRDDISDICEIFYLQNKINAIDLPTNGFYTEKIYNNVYKILHKCPNIDFSISLPLDGLQETHDKIKGMKGSFEKVIETVKGLAALKNKFNNLSIYIITVVNQLNLNEVVKLSEFIKNNLLVNGHRSSPMHGAPYDKSLAALSYKEWGELSKELIGYHSYWNKKTFDSKLKAILATNRMRYLYNRYSQVLKDKKLPFRCQAGSIIGVLEPNGDIRLCEITEVVGNVRAVNYDFKKIWFSDIAEEMRKKTRGCACTHGCFLAPSIKMSLPSLVNSYLGR